MCARKTRGKGYAPSHNYKQEIIGGGDGILSAETFFLGGLLGFFLGRGRRETEWEPFIEKYDERSGQVSYFKVTIPYGAYKKSDTAKLAFAEAYYAYAFGLPNSAISMAIKALENCLKVKYSEEEGKKPALKLVDLIDWSKEKLSLTKGEVGHAIRLLRNEVMHEERTIEETEALQTIKHVSLLLNELYPFKYVKVSPQCRYCRNELSVTIGKNDAYIGYTTLVACGNCRRNQPFTLNT